MGQQAGPALAEAVADLVYVLITEIPPRTSTPTVNYLYSGQFMGEYNVIRTAEGLQAATAAGVGQSMSDHGTLTTTCLPLLAHHHL